MIVKKSLLILFFEGLELSRILFFLLVSKEKEKSGKINEDFTLF